MKKIIHKIKQIEGEDVLELIVGILDLIAIPTALTSALYILSN